MCLFGPVHFVCMQSKKSLSLMHLPNFMPLNTSCRQVSVSADFIMLNYTVLIAYSEIKYHSKWQSRIPVGKSSGMQWSSDRVSWGNNMQFICKRCSMLEYILMYMFMFAQMEGSAVHILALRWIIMTIKQLLDIWYSIHNKEPMTVQEILQEDIWFNSNFHKGINLFIIKNGMRQGFFVFRILLKVIL